MWSLVGHKCSKGFLCDLCGFASHSMGRLIHHVHAHGVTRVEPLFLFGVLYGELPKEDKEEGGRLRLRRRRSAIPSRPRNPASSPGSPAPGATEHPPAPVGVPADPGPSESATDPEVAKKAWTSPSAVVPDPATCPESLTDTASVACQPGNARIS